MQVLRPSSCVLFTLYDSWNMFSAKLWFVKTSTRIIKYKLRIVKSYLAVYFYHYKIFHLIKLSDPAPVPWKIYKNVFFKSFLRVWIWSGKCLSEILFHVKTMPLPLIRSPSKGGVNWTEGGEDLKNKKEMEVWCRGSSS